MRTRRRAIVPVPRIQLAACRLGTPRACVETRVAQAQPFDGLRGPDKRRQRETPMQLRQLQFRSRSRADPCNALVVRSLPKLSRHSHGEAGASTIGMEARSWTGKSGNTLTCQSGKSRSTAGCWRKTPGRTGRRLIPGWIEGTGDE